MKQTIILLITFCIAISCSNRIMISGTATTDVKNTTVLVSANDTINKFAAQAHELTMSNLEKLIANNKYVSRTNDKGWFTINPKKSDSLTFHASYHISQTHAVTDLLKKKYPYIKLDRLPCDIIECNDTILDLYAVVARKISVERSESGYCKDVIRLDSKYLATYEIIENIYGNFDGDTIQFTVFDHSGRPSFEEHENVLIYVYKTCNTLYHVRYQYANVYRTADGRWASPYSAYYYGKSLNHVRAPEIINFAERVVFPIEGASNEWVTKQYPMPYYKIERDTAIAIYGNYVEDMFELAKDPVLKNFGFKFSP